MIAAVVGSVATMNLSKLSAYGFILRRGRSPALETRVVAMLICPTPPLRTLPARQAHPYGGLSARDVAGQGVALQTMPRKKWGLASEV